MYILHNSNRLNCTDFYNNNMQLINFTLPQVSQQIDLSEDIYLYSDDDMLLLVLHTADYNCSYVNSDNGIIYELKSADYAEPTVELTVEELKEAKIAESKLQLAEWFTKNPMLYSDNKYYSVTEEKQALLNSNLASYERAQAAGIPYPLKWNSIGAERIEWTYENLVRLSLSTAGYVAPKVSMQ